MNNRMTISEYTQLFDDDVVEAMYFQPISGKQYSKKTISQMVFRKLHDSNSMNNEKDDHTQWSILRGGFQFSVAITIVVVLAAMIVPISVIGIFQSRHESGRISDDSKIGQEIVFTPESPDNTVVIYDYETGEMYNSNHELLMTYHYDTGFVTDINGNVCNDVMIQMQEDGTFRCIPISPSDNHYVYFSTEKTNDQNYIISDLMLANGEICILTSPDQMGWKRSENTQLYVNIEKYPVAEDNPIQEQTLEVGVIFQDEIIDSASYRDITASYTPDLDVDKEYYVFVRNISSDPLSIKNISIEFK